MNVFVFILLFLSIKSFASELDYVPYLKMQESLVADDLIGSLEAHKLICNKELIHIENNYQDCEKHFSDINELRSSFKILSDIYIRNGNMAELKKLQIASCPMVKANWIQSKGRISNPYLGKSMIDCGEKI